MNLGFFFRWKFLSILWTAFTKIVNGVHKIVNGVHNFRLWTAPPAIRLDQLFLRPFLITFSLVEILRKFFLEVIPLEKRKFCTDPEFWTRRLFRGYSRFCPKTFIQKLCIFEELCISNDSVENFESTGSWTAANRLVFSRFGVKSL